MKPTKRQIRIVEDFVKKTTKKVMNEATISDSKDKLLARLVGEYAKQSFASSIESAAKEIVTYCKRKYGV